MPYDDTLIEQQHLLEEARASGCRPLAGRERASRLAAAVGLVAVAACLWFVAPPGYVDVPLLIALVAGLAVTSRIEFEIGPSYTAPIQLVLFPLLLLVPPAVALPAVAAGLALGLLPEVLRRHVHPDRLIVAAGNAWFAVGPAILLAVVPSDDVSLDRWPLYVALLAAQFASDAISSSALDWLARGVPPRVHLHTLADTWTADALLTPVALAVACAGSEEGWAALLGLPLAALLGVFARQRREGLDAALELSSAYRRTALLLGDVIDADDEYTGSHSDDVVRLATRVADALGLDRRRRHLVELGAMLHDVGKIRIPKSILRKPGPLDDAEFAEMKRHTLYGQELLDRVGGPLAEVGVIVRASHERFDGRGYPDGVAGRAIPLEARIVGCCDAFSAMTTDRPYRAALPVADAVAELRACAGTQFDPAVVRVVCALVERADAAPVRRAA